MPYKILFSLFLISTLLINFQKAKANSSEESTLSLDEVMEIALDQNPELKAMGKDAEATKARVSQARSWDDPQVGVRFYQVPWGGDVKDAMDIDYIISQKIPFPGKKSAASKIVYHDYLHHFEQAQGKLRELLRDVKSTYYSLFSVEKMIAASQEAEQIFKKTIQTSQSQVAGNLTLSDSSIQGQLGLTQILITRQSLLEQKAWLTAKLNQLMSRNITQKISLPQKIEKVKNSLPLEELIRLGQEQNSSVIQAVHQIGQKDWQIKAAKREYLPDLNAQVEYIQRPGVANNAWTGEFMINIPLWLNKKIKGVTQARAEQASAEYNHQATKNELAFNISEAYAKMQAADKTLEMTNNFLIPQAKQSFEYLASSYSAGKSDLSNLLTGAQNLFESRIQYWESFLKLALASFELEQLAGITEDEIQQRKFSEKEKL